MSGFLIGLIVGIALTLFIRRGLLMYKHQGSILLAQVNMGVNHGVPPYTLRIYVRALTDEYSKAENMRCLKHFGGLMNDLFEHARDDYPNLRSLGGAVDVMQEGVLKTMADKESEVHP